MILPNFFIAALALAAAKPVVPPTATSIYPAGGRIGTTVEVAVTGSFESWPVQVWCDAKGVSATAAKEKGKFRIAIAADARPGIGYLRFFNAGGASGLRPFAVATIPEIEEKEPNDDYRKPQVVEGPSALVNGKLQKNGDVDCFGIKLKKGQTLVASLLANRLLKSPIDAVMQIVSSDGFVLAQNNDYRELDPQIAFEAPADGTYIVRVFAFPAAPDASIRFFGSDLAVYRLTLTTAGFADYAWPLAVSFGKPNQVEMRGWNIPAKDRQFSYEPAKVGECKVTRPGLANHAAVRCEAHDCFEYSEVGLKRILKPPFTLSGKVEAAPRSRGVRFAGSKGQPLALKVESASLGFLLTPVLKVFDASEKELARAEPPVLNGDCELAFSPAADGTYEFRVADLHGRSGERFAYRIGVAPKAPDFELGVAADRYTVGFGKAVEIPVTIKRLDGFAADVDFAIEGLPEGVKFEALPPAKKDDKVRVLKVTANGKPFGGSLRIVGTARGASHRSKAAEATVAELEIKAETLWLTVARDAAIAKAVEKKSP